MTTEKDSEGVQGEGKKKHPKKPKETRKQKHEISEIRTKYNRTIYSYIHIYRKDARARYTVYYKLIVYLYRYVRCEWMKHKDKRYGRTKETGEKVQERE